MANLAKKVSEYLTRKDIERIPLTKKGLYEIISGTQNEYDRRESLGIFKGRYVDVLLKAFELREFYGWYCTEKDLKLQNHGRVQIMAKALYEEVPLNQTIIQYIKDYNAIKKASKKLAEKETKLKEKIESLDEIVR